MSRLGKTIWETSRADESTISGTGANNVAAAILDLLGSSDAWLALTDAGIYDEDADLALSALADWLGGDTDE